MTERENAATTGMPTSAPDGNTKSGRGNESGRGGRKKYVTLLGVSVIPFLIAYDSCDAYPSAFLVFIP